MRKLLNITCPKCFIEGHGVNPEYWTHGGNCDGYLYIDETGIVSCEKCGKNASIKRMRFTCNCGRHQYSISSSKGWGGSICASLNTNESNTLNWIHNLIKHL